MGLFENFGFEGKFKKCQKRQKKWLSVGIFALFIQKEIEVFLLFSTDFFVFRLNIT